MAQSFLTSQKAAKTFVTNKKAAKTYVTNKAAGTTYLKKKAASNLYQAKASAPLPPIGAVAAGTAQFGPISATTAGYIPGAFSSFATKAAVSNVAITFSGTGTCTAPKPAASLACPVSILVDGQVAGKVNLLPSTASSPTPVPVVSTILKTSVLTKGGHTVAIQYAGQKEVTFTLKTWDLAVESFPQPEEAVETTPTTTTK